MEKENVIAFMQKVHDVRRECIAIIESNLCNPKIVPALQQYVQACMSLSFVEYCLLDDGEEVVKSENPA